MKNQFGFTLIELLVVMGILAIVLSVTIIAVNPAEQLGKANDLATRAAILDLEKAANIYFASEKAYPWEKNENCRTELDTGGEFSNMGECIKEMAGIDIGDLDITKKKQYEKIQASICKEQAVMCYVPNTKEEIPNATYNKWGVVDPGCPGDKERIGKDCYWCKRVKFNETCEAPPEATLSGTLTPTPTTEIPTYPSPAPDITCNTEPEYEPKFFVGYCGVRRTSTSGDVTLPGTYISDGFAVPDITEGYARRKVVNNSLVPEYNTTEFMNFNRTELWPNCTTGVYESLMRAYCETNSEPAFWEIIVYKANGCKHGNGNTPLNHNLDYCEKYERLPEEPTDANCDKGITKSLEFPTISAKAGETVSQKLIVTNNNPVSCAPTQYVTSYEHYTGYSVIGLPNSFYVSAGETKEFPFSIYVSSAANPYWEEIYRKLSFWVYPGIESGEPLNTIINITSSTPAPTEQMFSNFGGKFYADYATFEFSYNADGNVSSRVDVATKPEHLEEYVYGPGELPPLDERRGGFAYSTGSAWDSSNSANPSSIRGIINGNPVRWPTWQCGLNFYYRIYNAGDMRISSPILTGTVDCETQVDILPWDPWYDAIYDGIYDARYDADNNGFVDWDDYWILLRDTRLR